MSKINVVHFKADSIMPKLIEIEDDLKSMQKLVGGLIEHASTADYGDKSVLSKYDIWCNEEGLLADKIVFNIEMDANTSLAGDIFVAGSDEEGATTSVDIADVPHVIAELASRMVMNEARKECRSRIAVTEKCAYMYFGIIADGRYFVKVEGDVETDIPVDELKKGDKFRIYSDSAKKDLVTYDDQHELTFECDGKTVINADGVKFIPAIVFKKETVK